jgi:hypothetical protein
LPPVRESQIIGAGCTIDRDGGNSRTGILATNYIVVVRTAELSGLFHSCPAGGFCRRVQAISRFCLCEQGRGEGNFRTLEKVESDSGSGTRATSPPRSLSLSLSFSLQARVYPTKWRRHRSRVRLQRRRRRVTKRRRRRPPLRRLERDEEEEEEDPQLAVVEEAGAEGDGVDPARMRLRMGTPRPPRPLLLLVEETSRQRRRHHRVEVVALGEGTAVVEEEGAPIARTVRRKVAQGDREAAEVVLLLLVVCGNSMQPCRGRRPLTCTRLRHRSCPLVHPEHPRPALRLPRLQFQRPRTKPSSSG